MVVGILGGGQLARMLALAGHPMGIRCVVLDPADDACSAPVATHLDVIVYSHEQLLIEAAAFPDGQEVPECDWGIVGIIGTLAASEPPMPPITQMRNALGPSEGGSGIPIDPDRYTQSVLFWEQHAAVK